MGLFLTFSPKRKSIDENEKYENGLRHAKETKVIFFSITSSFGNQVIY